MAQENAQALGSIQLWVNGLRFTGLEAGPKDGELVLLLHGFPQFADSWIPILRLLAAAGLRGVAMDQRGYSPGARPPGVAAYAIDRLVSDVLGFAEQLGAARFHLVGHDWGGLVAWKLAAAFPERLRTVSVVSTPHIDAFQDALRSSFDQINRSKYILLFKLPRGVPEWALLAADARALRKAYAGKVPPSQVAANVRRIREGGTLTAALNWYRALRAGVRIGPVSVPALYVWGDQDQALGEAAALGTARYCPGEYHFHRLAGRSHWLLEEVPEDLAMLLLAHILKRSDAGGRNRREA